jgi:hypothetical protein
MRRLLVFIALSILPSTSAAYASVNDAGSSAGNGGNISVGIVVETPGAGVGGHGGDGSARPLVQYDVSWSVDPIAAQTGSLNGLCIVPGGTGVGAFGFEYHLVGRDAAGNIVDDRFVCVAFVNGDPRQRPPQPAVPAIPTFGEAWNSVQLPPPAVTLDPARRGITGLDTRISTAGPATVGIAATIRGYTITGIATLDHYTISVDGGPATYASNGHYTFETKGDHIIAISAIWHGVATISGPDLSGAIPAVDLGDATITSTRTYPVNEIRSVLQP